MSRMVWLVLACSMAVLPGCNRCGAEKAEQHHDKEGHGEKEKATHEGGAEHGDQEVRLSEQAISRSGIKLGEVRRQPLLGALKIPAEVRLDPDRSAHITPIVQSQIGEVKVGIGDRVKKGQALVVLRSVELGEARAEVAKAKSSLEVAQDRVARQHQLLDAGVGTQKTAVEAEGDLKTAKAAVAAAQSRAGVYGGAGGGTVKSPLDGTVIERHATAGEVASPERPMFVIADLTKVWVMGRVYERDVGRVTIGSPATVRLQAFAGRGWSGVVDYVSPVLDESTRSAEVRVTLENSDGVLKPGLFGTLLISNDEGGTGSLAVPEASVQRIGERDVVFAPAGEPGTFKPIPITVGARSDGWVEILGGLSDGQKIVVEGAFTLKSALLAGELEEGHAH